MFARGIIQAEALNFIRGRSFVKTYLIVDEAQNTTPNQIKGIITRAGKGDEGHPAGVIPTRSTARFWMSGPTAFPLLLSI